MEKFKFFLLYFFLVLTLVAFAHEDPSVLYLSWLRDPSSTMTIQWLAKDNEESRVYYNQKGEQQWHEQKGTSYPINASDEIMHVAELDHLAPNTIYSFKIGVEGSAYSFRTMPKSLEEHSLKFAVGGDAYFYLKLFEEMNHTIAKHDPDFIVVGGDIAYTKGKRGLFVDKEWEFKRWKTFFENWKKQMVTSDGRLIPILAVVGNHDVRSKSEELIKQELFYQFFIFPTPYVSYRALDFEEYLSLFFLDTDHTYPIESKQTDWLEQALSERQEALHKIALYHVAAYPSVYAYGGKIPKKIRRHWVPLFEKYGVSTAFEHHNHAYKVTKRLKQGKTNPSGVLYLGDGSWGVTPRKVKNRGKRKYLAKVVSVNSFWLATITKESSIFDSYTLEGKLLDHIEYNINH